MARHVTLIALTSGAFVAVNAQHFARLAQIQEDETGPPGGLVLKWPDGTVAEYGIAQQPIKIENPGGGAGPLVGVPAKNPDNQSYVGCGQNATQYCQAKSVGATSVLQLSEDD